MQNVARKNLALGDKCCWLNFWKRMNLIVPSWENEPDSGTWSVQSFFCRGPIDLYSTMTALFFLV